MESCKQTDLFRFLSFKETAESEDRSGDGCQSNDGRYYSYNIKWTSRSRELKSVIAGQILESD